MNINQMLAKEFNLRQEQIDNTVALIDDDKTIPFIARYRKEQTGSLDDTVLRELSDRLTYLRNLEKRKDRGACKSDRERGNACRGRGHLPSVQAKAQDKGFRSA